MSEKDLIAEARKSLEKRLSRDVEELFCKCSHTFKEHQKPPANMSWDACSFPCLRCPCQEFIEARYANEPLNEAGERWDDDYGLDPRAALHPQPEGTK